MEGSHGGRRPAAAPARHTIESPWIGSRPIRGVLRGRAHRELVHVRLAKDDGARLTQPLGDVRVIWRDVAFEDPRTCRALATRQRDKILERDRDAEQRAKPVQRMCLVRSRGGEPGVGGIGFGERPVAVDRQPCVERPVVALRGREMRLGQLAGRDVAAPQQRSHVVGVQARQIGHRPISARRGWPGRR